MSRSRARSVTANDKGADLITTPFDISGISGGLEAVKEGFLVYKKKKRWVVLDTQSLTVFKTPMVRFSFLFSSYRSFLITLTIRIQNISQKFHYNAVQYDQQLPKIQLALRL